MSPPTDNIVAVATPPGRGGISVVRLSGPGIPGIAKRLLGHCPATRQALLTDFPDEDGVVIDRGIALFFEAPNSFTGENVLELQGHGSPVVMQMLVRRCLGLGARLARPGEFSERAFLNGQMDLAQAEAVADLIESSTESAARSAIKSLQGAFSGRIQELTDSVIALRIYVEAAIDFPDEEIDFLEDGKIRQQLEDLVERFESLRDVVRQGKLLRDGLRVVLTGLPNAGKSSLLNALADEQRAIVSTIPGTTRDTLDHHMEIDGLAVEIMDTAGIRETGDEIEAEGVRRAQEAQKQADLVLLVVDDNCANHEQVEKLAESQEGSAPLLLVYNKIDLSGRAPGAEDDSVAISALDSSGLAELRQKIREVAGFRDVDESQFLARQRHLDALHRAERHLLEGVEQHLVHGAGELLAEDLKACQQSLGEITGEVSSDDLLGFIFSSFCIGK